MRKKKLKITQVLWNHPNTFPPKLKEKVYLESHKGRRSEPQKKWAHVTSYSKKKEEDALDFRWAERERDAP